MARFLPYMNLFQFSFVRLEALYSSQIEGTQSTLDDLLRFEHGDAPGVPKEDTRAVSNYIDAITYALENHANNIGTELLNQMHARLLSNVRGKDRQPGQLRQHQNWVGGTSPDNTRYVPPPAGAVPDCMAQLMSFIHSSDLPPIVVAGLAHAQFESIHPYLDGNGRLGRMLVTLILIEKGVLSGPSLYISAYLRKYRDQYYLRLQAIREQGEWEAWLQFFLVGVAQIAKQALRLAMQIVELIQKDQALLSQEGQRAATLLSVHRQLADRLVVEPAQLVALTQLSYPTVLAALATMQALGIAKETTGHERNRKYRYEQYYHLLAQPLI
jgi:Fic family protein